MRPLIGLSQSMYINKILKRFKTHGSKRVYIYRHDLGLSKAQSHHSIEELNKRSKVPYASVTDRSCVSCYVQGVMCCIPWTWRVYIMPILVRLIGWYSWTFLNIWDEQKACFFFTLGKWGRSHCKELHDIDFRNDKHDSCLRSRFMFLFKLKYY